MSPKDVIAAYISALDGRDYDAARRYLADTVFIKGPAGEAFRTPDAFLEMMSKQQGTYEILKTFADGDDVCLLYNFVTPSAKVFFCSWYQVKNGQIASIQTVFDPTAFANR